MLLRLWHYLAGSLLIEVRGRRPERFFNLAAEKKIDLWEIVRKGDGVVAWVALGDLRALRPVSRRARCRVRIRGRQGLPFLLRRMLRRRVLLTGALFCVAAIWWVTAHIWMVEVRGTRQLDPWAVRAAAADLGLKPGAWKARIDLQGIEEALPRQVPELTWAAIEVQGTRVIIQVAERTTIRAPFAPEVRRDIVAAKEALVESVLVLAGRAAVKRGDLVQPGEVLIAGQVTVAPGPPVPATKEPEGELALREIPAEGVVTGRVRYRRYWEVPTVEVIEEKTGRWFRRWTLHIGQAEFILKGTQPIPFAHHHLTERRYQLPWRKSNLPVEVKYLISEEVLQQQRQLSPDEVEQAALARMAAWLNWQLVGADRVVMLQAEVVRQGSDRAGIIVTAETIEEIGVPRDAVAPVHRPPMPPVPPRPPAESRLPRTR